MANMRKKKNRTIPVSPKCPKAKSNAVTNFFKPLNLFTVFKGRRILKALNPASPDILVPFKTLSTINNIQPTTTTKKSRIFQVSLIYASSADQNRKAIIFKTLSIV